MKTTTLLLLFAMTLMAAKGRDWKTGKVLDAAAKKRYLQTGTQDGVASLRENRVLIEGDDYTYTISDLTFTQPGMVIFNHARGCRFIVGEEIKYVADKRFLHIQDVDGKECKVEIMRQAKTIVAAPPAIPPGVEIEKPAAK